MVDISSELVGDGGLGTGTKELSFGLEVVDTMLKFSYGFGKGRVNFSEVCVGVCRGTKGVTKEAGTGGDFGRGIPRVLVNVMDGGLEVQYLSQGERYGSGEEPVVEVRR
jgi:hypothetical protein